MEWLGEKVLSPVHRFSVSPDQPYGGYALDAIDWYDPENEGKSHKSDVMAYLKDSLTAVPETRPAVGKGIDYRFSSERVTGFALCLDDRILHLSIFAKTNGMEHAAQGSRISRF